MLLSFSSFLVLNERFFFLRTEMILKSPSSSRLTDGKQCDLCSHTGNSDCDLRRPRAQSSEIGSTLLEAGRRLYNRAMGLLLACVTMYWEDR